MVVVVAMTMAAMLSVVDFFDFLWKENSEARPSPP
jgi:hypothetical protein